MQRVLEETFLLPAKRDFSRTAEPSGDRRSAPPAKARRYVIQKHDRSGSNRFAAPPAARRHSEPATDSTVPPAAAKAAKISPREQAMATRLVEEMTDAWKPDRYKDSYRRDLMRRIREKIRKRQTHVLTPTAEPEEAPRTAEIIDLTAILRKSLRSRGARAAAHRPKRRARA